jgi:hypothetical protein
MSRTTLVYLILIILLLGLLPVWPYSQPWGMGWYPPGIILIVIVLFLLMRL